MSWLRCTASAKDISPDQRFCTCCERPLARRVAWLELDQRIGGYHDIGDVPEDRSQGWFPFGLTCAHKAKEAALVKLRDVP